MHLDNVRRALAAFERTLLSFDSPYDRWLWRDDEAALTEAARAGARLFFSERFGCSDCHGGLGFSAPPSGRSGA